MLSYRVKNVLPTVIDESQSAFLKDRGMFDIVPMNNEVVEELMRNESSGLCLKVDYERCTTRLGGISCMI